MRIGIVISRIGGEDGVALETEKWIEVLHRMNHEVFLITGKYERNILDKWHQKILKEFILTSKNNLLEQKRTFVSSIENPREILRDIEEKSDIISNKIKKWIGKNSLDVIIIENICALPSNLSMTLGIKKAIEETHIKTITHDHDFYWERGKRYISHYREINNLVRKIIPLRLSNVINVVINSAAQEILNQKYGLIKTTVIPNVMDFDKEYGNSLNNNFLINLGLKEGDIVLLQATRILRRKGIGTAIKLIHKLNNKKIKLIITGNNNDEKENDSFYYKTLKYLVKKLGLKNQIIFAWKKFRSSLLFDAYSCADACTYFSEYEGFGNAFIEAVVAKKPIFVNNYKPVFWQDIGSKGFKIVMIENNILTDETVEKIKEIIYNKKLQKEITDHNFEIGKKYFSYEVLEKKLEEVLKSFN